MGKEEIIQKLKTYLNNNPEIPLCLLFGSIARDTLREDSDIDIAVCSSSEISAEKLAEMQVDLSDLLKREVDLLDIAILDGLILQQVLTNCIRVKNEKPELLAYFIKKMLFYDADMLPNYRMMIREKVKRFAHGK